MSETPTCPKCDTEGVPIGVEDYYKCPNEDCPRGVCMTAPE